MTKYILVTGGLLSGIGKGVIASSVGRICKELGFKTTAIKIDPYLNIDAGTMSPYEHGEVYVLDDGGEVDLDLGNYERFMDITLSRDNNITTGKIYKMIIEKERRGDYLGKTVQVIPHVCDEIQDWIERVATRPMKETDVNSIPDICVIELGGTIGDIEQMPFVEAMRQFQFRVGRENFCELHVSLVPILGTVGEQKTKPTQHSIKELRSLGISPDIILCRSEVPLEESTKKKISSFCHVAPSHVIGVHDVPSILDVPPLLVDQQVHKLILDVLKLTNQVPHPEGASLTAWRQLAQKQGELMKEKEKGVRIAIVGKYTHLSDAYLSISKAFSHCSLHLGVNVNIDWVEATDLETQMKEADVSKFTESWKIIHQADAILVPGGFGDRGVEGKIAVANYARTHQVPYLGICLGFQVAVIEFCRNVLKKTNATSTEFDIKTQNPVIIHMPDYSSTNMGGTMRLGKKDTIVKSQDTKIAKLYGNPSIITERHRHRYEVNPEMIEEIEKEGLEFVGVDVQRKRMSIFELKQHPYFVGTQFHPEFLSRPLKPSPPFVGLVQASIEHKAQKQQK